MILLVKNWLISPHILQPNYVQVENKPSGHLWLRFVLFNDRYLQAALQTICQGTVMCCVFVTAFAFVVAFRAFFFALPFVVTLIKCVHFMCLLGRYINNVLTDIVVFFLFRSLRWKLSGPKCCPICIGSVLWILAGDSDDSYNNVNNNNEFIIWLLVRTQLSAWNSI